MQIKLNSKQYKAFELLQDNQTKELIFGGGAGGGKTFIGCFWLLVNNLKYSGSKWVMGRSKLKSLKETTLATFFEVAYIFNLKPGSNYLYNAQDSIINFDNESKIILKDLFSYPSDPNFDSLGSLEITGAFVDECNQISLKAWEVLKSRIRYKLNEFNLIPKILGTCNPSKNWVYTEFYKPSIEKKINNDRKFIQALVTDNPFISDHYINNLKSIKNKAIKERLLLGNWEYDDDPACLFSFDVLNDLFSNKATGEDKYLIVDVARKGKDRTILRYFEGLQSRETINLQDKIKSNLEETRKYIEKFISKKQIRMSHVLVDEDGVGGGLVDSLGCIGFLNGASPIKENGVLPNYQNLRSQCWFKLAEYAEKGIIGIDDNEEKEKLIEELSVIKQKDIDKDGKIQVIRKEDIKELIGRSTDYADTLMMRMFFELQQRPAIDLI